MYKNIGYHTSVKDLLTKDEEFFKNHEVMQVFVGNPRSLSTDHDYLSLARLIKEHPNTDFVVHASYTTNLCKAPDDSITKKTISYLVNHAYKLDEIGVKKLVVHTGARPEDASVEQSAKWLWRLCRVWLAYTSSLSIKLLLENDVGSKKNTRMGDMRIIGNIVKNIDDPRLRICYDFEHGYGGGFDFSTIDDYKDIISLVHLNSIPKTVEFGSHIDRHTSTTFYDSKKDINKCIDFVLDNGIGSIMEIEPDLVDKNYQYLEEVYNGVYWTKSDT